MVRFRGACAAHHSLMFRSSYTGVHDGDLIYVVGRARTSAADTHISSMFPDGLLPCWVQND
jgi:hypothetical protein